MSMTTPSLRMASFGAVLAHSSLTPSRLSQARAARRGDIESQIDDSLDYDNPHIKAGTRRSLTLAAVATVR